MDDDARVLQEAKFDDRVCTYWLLSGALVFVMSIVGIPLLLLWFPIGKNLTRRYLARMSCVLTDTKLHFKKGLFVRVESTVPLDRITDLGVVQGPIMRHYGLWRLTIETAGQSGPGMALLSMTGIVDTREFRERVLEARDALVALKGGGASEAVAPSSPAATAAGDGSAVLVEVRDTLSRIEQLLRDQAAR